MGLFVALMGGYNLLTLRVPARFQGWMRLFNSGLIALGVALVLTSSWQPLGLEKGFVRNFIFVALFIGGIIVAFRVFQRFYSHILGWCLNHKPVFLALPLFQQDIYLKAAAKMPDVTLIILHWGFGQYGWAHNQLYTVLGNLIGGILFVGILFQFVSHPGRVAELYRNKTSYMLKI